MRALNTNIVLLHIRLLYKDTGEHYYNDFVVFYVVLPCANQLKHFLSSVITFVGLFLKITSFFGWIKALFLPGKTFIRKYRLNTPCFTHHLW